MRSYRTVKKKLLSRPRTRRAYDTLEPEYALIAAIIELRLKAGLTQAELAQRMGTKQSAISRLERGTYNPSLQFLKKCADALGAKLRIGMSA